jgi:hypothetical protein
VLRSIVSGPLDADKQDYLLRDSRFCGVPYGVFDIHQLHRSFALVGPEGEKQLMVERDGVPAVEQYALAKYHMTTLVYRHRVRLITDQMLVRAIRLGIVKDNDERLRKLYQFDNSEDFIREYVGWDDGRFMHEFCVGAPPSKCQGLLDRLVHRKLLKRVFEARTREFSPEVRDSLGRLSDPEDAELRTRLENAIAHALAELTGQRVDPDLVVVNVFSIRSVKEMSRNDEAGILVIDTRPEPFDQVSTLFASINEGYADEYLEVYAPVEWDTPTDKKSIIAHTKQFILDLVEEHCNPPPVEGGTA